MKFRLLLLSLFTLSLHSQDSAQTYQTQAQLWATKVIKRVDPAYLEDLLLLLELSYQRSYTMLVTQQEYLNLLARLGTGWNHILATRLNPSKDADFDTTSIDVDAQMLKQIAHFQQAVATQHAYAALLDRLANNDNSDYPQINYASCRKLIDELREQARSVVAQTLIEKINDIQQELHHAYTEITQAAELFSLQGQFKSRFATKTLTELLWWYMPDLMMRSFVNFDKGFTSGTQAYFAAFIESQKAGNDIWHCIEVERASYYAAHYQALYTTLEKHMPELLLAHPAPETLQQLVDYTCSH